MASPSDLQLPLKSDKVDSVTDHIGEKKIELQKNDEHHISLEGSEIPTDKPFIIPEKFQSSWNKPDDNSSTFVSSEEVCVNGLNKVEVDGCGQHISSRPVHLSPEASSISGDHQFQMESSSNIPHVYACNFGAFHPTVPKVNYSNRGPSPNRRYSSNSHGTSPCHQIAGNSNVNTVNVSGNGQHIVLLHVNPGETISFHMGDHMQLIQGPATVRMVSSNSTPPIPMPVQVPPGHMVQQIVDENGTLRHIILSPQPPVAVPMGSPYNPAPTAATANTASTSGTSPFFVYPHPSFPSPAQFHPHMQPGLGSQGLHSHGGSHLQPQQSSSNSSHPGSSAGVSGPPHLSAHKDERTQRQHFKLKKRLEARQKDTTVFPETSPSSSPRKDSVRNKDKQGIPEEETELKNHSEESTKLIGILSTIKAPVVSEITARSALVKWTALEFDSESIPDVPKQLQESSILYNILLSEKSKDNRPKVVHSGSLLEHELGDLKPASMYYLCVQAVLDELSGNVSEHTSFKTLSCEPDAPQSPKLVARAKTYISLKWNATADNGSRILSYILEYDEGCGEDNFVELFSGLQKQFKAVKLNPSTCYKFRLAAANEYGKSSYSEVSCFSTSGSTPSQPLPPSLKSAHINKLTLTWQARPNDDDFTLQMEDEATRHGFLPVYNGKDISYTCVGLKRNTEYKFRLCANNEEGSSPWSQVVFFRTVPDKPSCPGQPYLKGRAHSTSLKVAWESPKDDGGSPVTQYDLEMDSGNGFKCLFSGLESEFQCEHLQPGNSYHFRVRCLNKGGTSLFSDVSTIATVPVIPGKCQPPRLFGKPRALSLHVKWLPPEYDGGSEILEFELEVINPDGSSRQAYKGTGTDCVVAGLHPGRQYKFQVRSYNKIGHGPWSDLLDVTSGAGTPDVPKDVSATARSSHSVAISWEEPCCNGAAITEYRVESSRGEEAYEMVYYGLQCNTEIKSLAPATLYSLRVQALNSAGAGPFCDPVQCLTLPSSPGGISVSSIKAVSSATTITLLWKEPANNGATISSYNVEVGDVVHTTDHPQICIEDLVPETLYKVRIQAVNSVGLGSFSSSLKVVTRGLPPCPPALECFGYGHNSLRLKWGDGKNPDFIQYMLEVENPATNSFIPVYQGTAHCHKVTKLQEVTTYNFRIYASNDEGDGPYSDIYPFTTLKAIPPALKAPKVSSVTETSCCVEWQPAKSLGSDIISYKLQLSTKDAEYNVVYSGLDTSFPLNGLQPSCEYAVRVVAVRHCSNGSPDLPGPFSPSSVFCTSHLVPLKSNPPKMVSAVASLTDRQPLTDQQWAIIILCGFTFFAIFVAIIIERALSYSRS